MEFEPCRRCASTDRNRPAGYLYSTLPSGQLALMECTCHREWREAVILRSKARLSGLYVPDTEFSDSKIRNDAEKYRRIAEYSPEKNYLGKQSLDNIIKLNNYIKYYADPSVHSTLLYFYGTPGTQKSSIAKWLAMEILRKGYSVRFLRMEELLVVLQPSFDDAETKELEEFYNKDLIIVDESFSKQAVSKWASGAQLPWLSTFIRSRIEDYRKGIVFVSNTPVNQIVKDGWPPALQDFMVRETTLNKSVLEFKDNYLELFNRIKKEGGAIQERDVFGNKDLQGI